MKISEDDLHAALAKSSDLPEDILKILIENLKEKCEENLSEKNQINTEDNNNDLVKSQSKNAFKNKSEISIFGKPENKKFLIEFEKEIEHKLIRKFKIFLNKSLVNIAKTVRKNADLFKNNKNFWLSLENEVLERCDSLTNEQITDIVCAFAKSEVADLKLLDEIEDIIIETTVPFSVRFFYFFFLQIIL